VSKIEELPIRWCGTLRDFGEDKLASTGTCLDYRG
jgi:hypothetical protein